MRSWALVLSLGTMPLFGCFTATDTVTGEDPLLVDPCQPGGANAGNRWQDLYACYFGPSGQASCGSRSGCHGAPDELGAKASGYICGATPDACWRGITGQSGDAGANGAGIVPAGGVPDATQTTLYDALRKYDRTGTGNMPLSSTYTFQASDLARIRYWIEHGAPND